MSSRFPRLRWRHALVSCFALAIVLLGGAWWEGGRLMAPAPALVPAPPDLPIEQITIRSTSGSELAAWFIPGTPGAGAVLLLHPLRANRAAMIGRARLLSAEGYSLLLVDLQAHGQSTGSALTFGWLESQDARSAIAYLRHRLPAEKLAGLGISLGGASLLLGTQPCGLDAVVAEAVYTSFEEALDNRLRMRLGPLAPLAAPLLSFQLRPRLGISPSALHPIDGAPNIGCPLLLVAGALDQHVTLAQSERLFGAARDPKELWIVASATHEDFLARGESAYKARVGAFLARYLRRGP